ncbi:MAG: murein biosynthesis integral membrane protein MurJ [Oscillospiraceae bacterium]|nr:murein biosynthesis integral membrane protein MurJ [Oscillospiraceae bacterium]
MEEKKKGSVRTVGLMMIITLLGKVLGLVRDRLLTVNYGSGMEANAFLTASRIPRVFFDAVFASAISASLIPVFSELLTKRGKKAACDFAGSFLTLMTALCALLTVLGMVFAGPLARLFAPGFDPQTGRLTEELTRIMMPTVIFTGVAFSFVGILQSLEEFNIPAAISLISNGAVIVYYLFFNRTFGIYGLAAAFLISWALQALVQIPSLIKKGATLRPSLRFEDEGLRKVLRLMLPVMVASWVLPVNQAVNGIFASGLFEGAGVSAVDHAYSLFTVIAGVFVLSVTNYIFPRLSRLAAGEGGDMSATLRGTLHTVMLVVVPMTVGLMAVSRPLVDFIFGGGKFDGFAVDITARALSFMALGTVGYALTNVLCRFYFARLEGLVPLLAGAAAVAANAILCAVLTPLMDVGGIALACALSLSVNGVLLAVPLGRRGVKLITADFALDMGKILLSALIMEPAVFFTRQILEGRGKLLTLIVPCAAGVLVYGIMILVLRLPEAMSAKDFILSRIGRKEK